MAGMTDTAFRRLVKRQGGCGLVVTEMVSSEGLVRGIDRTLEYTEFTEEERPVSIQIFGGDPEKMADAAQIVESLGADIVDVNMGCPVPKIAKHNAGCSLMREPEHAASVIAAMTKKVRIPVTVKMRAGWNDESINAPDLARRVEDAGAAAVAVHGRTAAQSYRGESDWSLIDRVAESLSIPVLGSGDCIEPGQILERMRAGNVSGVLVGRGVLRNPWILAQADDLAAGRPRAAHHWMKIAAAFCSTTWSCCCTKARTKPKGSGTARDTSNPDGIRTNAGSSTRCARSCRGTRRASTTAATCARPSTPRRRSRRRATSSSSSSA